MMKKLTFLAVILFSVPVFAAQRVGQVVDLVGTVWITASGQKPGIASFKQPIYLGDTIETKATDAIKILFEDDTLLTVKENSKILITEFLFHPQSKQRKAVFNVLFGTIRTVVGKFFGENQSVEIKTPTAIAGIRGTDVGAVVKPKSTKLYCFNGIFDAFNIDLPGKIVKVTEGTYTEILEKKPPTELMPIPEDIQDNKMQTFDIPLKTTSQGSGTQSAGAQLVQGATREVTTETRAIIPATTGGETANASGTTLAYRENASQTEDFVTTTTPSTTSSPDSSGEILPGGTPAVTNPTTIVITFTLVPL